MVLRISKTAKRTLASLIIALMIAAALYLLSIGNGILQGYVIQLERIFYDLSFRITTLENFQSASQDTQIRDSQTLEDRIQIIDIDERSLDRLGAYNLWPRTHHAAILRELNNGGASAIVFDILFKNADFGVSKTQELLDVIRQVRPGIAWEEDSAAIRSLLNHDSILIQAVQQNGNTIVCAMMNSRQSYVHKSQWQPLSEPQWQQRIGTAYTVSAKQVPPGTADAMDLLDNIFPQMAQAGKLGLVNVLPDEDGVHRSIPLMHGFPNPELYPDAEIAYYPVISLQTVLHLFGYHPSDLKIEPGRYVEIGKPLGVYRDSSGLLRTTYPNLTWPMLRAFLERRSDIARQAGHSGQSSMLEIATRVAAKRTPGNTLSIDIFNAQTLDSAMLATILDPVMSWEHLQNARTTPFTHSSRVQITWSEDEDLPLLINPESGNESTINRYTFDVIQEYASDLDHLSPGSSRYLSADLDIRFRKQDRRWHSNFIIFNNAVVEDLLQTDPASVTALLPGAQPLRFGSPVRIPVDSRNRMQIHYRGRYTVPVNQRPFRQISYFDVLAGRVDPGFFQGRIFILGSTAPALFDLVSAPHESVFPGVLIHATLLENILNNRFLSVLPDSGQLWIILLVALYCALAASFLKPLYSFPLLIISIIAYFFITLSFFSDGLYIGAARQVLTLISVFFAMMVLRYIFEEREKLFLNETFRQYISPELIDQMVHHQVKPVLGGVKSNLSAFFTDIAGFSTFSEKIGDPARLVELLNEYLSAMTDILTQNKGTLDKYEGDAIIAFFGAPMPLENHRQSACITALYMQNRLAELRRKWALEGTRWPEIVHSMHMRIGINSGEIVTGNMGSSMRKNYTMMGDAVNLAARLESAAKHYGALIHVSRTTVEGLIPGTIVYRSLDRIQVVGKTQPVDTYELLALNEHASSDLLRLVELWEQGRAAYLAMQWEKAITIFEQCLEREPHHPERDAGCFTTPSHVYLERCRKFRIHPPVPAGQEWNGVYTATSK